MSWPLIFSTVALTGRHWSVPEGGCIGESVSTARHLLRGCGFPAALECDLAALPLVVLDAGDGDRAAGLRGMRLDEARRALGLVPSRKPKAN
jgi:hypothetical protein